MKKNVITHLILGSIFYGGVQTAALAGPTHEIYKPVKTVTQARKLPVGTRIALSCDNGGPVTIVTIDEKRDYMRGFTCPVSKNLYRFSPGGGAHGSDLFLYKTDSGLTAHLLTLGKL